MQQEIKLQNLFHLEAKVLPMTFERALDETPDLKTLYENDADTKK